MFSVLRFFTVNFVTALHALAAISVGVFDRGGRRSSAIVGAWARTVLRLGGVEVRIEGRDRLPAGGPVLFVATHRSLLDVPALYCAFPPTTRFVAKRELFRVPIFGLALRLLGFVSIDRGDRRRARESLTSAALSTRDDRSLAMFPEGTRNPGTGLLPLKNGAFALAIEHGLTIVPIACVGGNELLPPHSLTLKSGRMTVRIGRSFEPGTPAFESRKTLAEAVRLELLELLDGE